MPYRKGSEALERNYGRLFFADHPFSELIRESAAWYAREIGIDTELILPLSAMTWTTYANRKREELDRYGESAGREHLPLIMVRDGACRNLELLAEHRKTYRLT